MILISNKFIFIFFFFIGCTQISNINKEAVYPILDDNKFCRGKGYISFSRDARSRFNFIFTSSKENLYLEMRDMLGRKQYLFTIEKNNYELFSIRENKKYSKESMLIAFPFFELLEPVDLIDFLWGIIPLKFQSNSDLYSNELNKIMFKTSESENGQLVNEISFQINNDNNGINLIIIEREFDMQYPHLINN